jgi:hypothetical protein
VKQLQVVEQITIVCHTAEDNQVRLGCAARKKNNKKYSKYAKSQFLQEERCHHSLALC